MATAVLLASVVAMVVLTLGGRGSGPDLGPGSRAGGRLPVAAGSDATTLSYLEAPTGEWTFAADTVVPNGQLTNMSYAGDGLASPQGLSFGDHLVVLVSAMGVDGVGTLVGLDAESGEVAWTSKVRGSPVCMDPAEVETLVCASVERTEDGQSPIVSFDPATGEELARTQQGFGYPVLSLGDTGEVFALESEVGGLVATALDQSDLGLRWQTDLAHPEVFDYEDSGRIRADGEQVTVNRAGVLWRLDQQTGRVVDYNESVGGFYDDGYVVEPDWTADEATTRVTDLGGFTLLTASGSPSGDARRDYVDDGRIGIGQSYYDLTDGAELWTSASISPAGGAYFSAERGVVLAGRGQITQLIDSTTGEVVATGPRNATGSSWWVDGDVAAVVDHDGILTLIDLTSGATAWTSEVEEVTYSDFFDSNDGTVSSTSAGLAVTGWSGVHGLTGFAAEDLGDDDGATEYVTDCGSEPELTPVESVAADGGVRITFDVTATCPGGQWLAYSDQQISVLVDGYTYASGTFDFAGDPRWVPDGGRTLDLVFPPGSTYATPEEINAGIARDGGSGDVVEVPCERGPDAAPGSVPSTPPETENDEPLSSEGSAEDEAADAESALEALRRIAAADAPVLDSDVAGSWVPQLSSKDKGLVANGITWGYPDILAEHLRLRLRYPGTRLAYSTDWGTYSEDDFWVTMLTQTSSTPGPALQFCRDQAFDSEHCYAKLLDREGPSDGAIKLLPGG